MTVLPIAIRWVAIDPPGERAALAAALGVDVGADGSIEIPGLHLEVVGASSAVRGRVELIAAAPGPGSPIGTGSGDAPIGKRAPAAGGPPGPTGFVACLIALGWSTVDVDRAASSRPDLQWDAAPRDSLVGARALVGRARPPAHRPSGASAPFDVRSDAGARAVGFAVGDPDAPPRPGAATHPVAVRAGATVMLVLLEPDTEGRIAASLARHGEGPAVLYVAVPGSNIAGMRRRLAGVGIHLRDGTGPFGPECAMVALPPSSATLVVVPDGDADEAEEPPPAGPRRGRRGTIGR